MLYIIYDLHVWPRNSTNNIKLKNCLSDAANTVKTWHGNNEKWVHRGYGITFDGVGDWSFGVDNRLSSQTDNCKKITF